MSLSEQKIQELNKAILVYLSENPNFAKSAEMFQIEAGLTSVNAHEVFLKDGNTLMKKWNAIVRLQGQIQSLNNQIKQLKEEGATNVSIGENKSSLINQGLIPQNPKTTLVGHVGSVNCLSMHPTYNHLCSGGEDGVIRIWDYTLYELIKTLKGHTDVINDVCYNTDGTNLASCSNDTTIKIWDISSYTCIKTLKSHDHSVSAVILRNDRLYSCSRDKTIRVWETVVGKCINSTECKEWVRDIDVNVDESILAGCCDDHNIYIYNIKDGHELNKTMTLYGHEQNIESVCFSNQKSEQMLLVGINENSDNKMKYSPSNIPMFLFSCSRDKSIRVWCLINGACIYNLRDHGSWVREVSIHPNGRYLYSISEDKSIKIWDLMNGSLKRTISNAHTNFGICMEFNKSGRVLASGGVDEKINIWLCS